MKKNCTEVVFILDRSESMCGLEKDTIGGFNSLINKQKKQDGEVLVSTVLFNDSSVVIHDRKPIDEVRLMTNKDYEVYGCTALLDALGSSIRHIGKISQICSDRGCSRAYDVCDYYGWNGKCESILFKGKSQVDD